MLIYETFAGIIADMRGDPSRGLLVEEDTINTRRVVRQFRCNYAERLEAARKREIAKKDGETVMAVIAEMRGDPTRGFFIEDDTINTRRIVRQFLANAAERLEAAYKREVGKGEAE